MFQITRPIRLHRIAAGGSVMMATLAVAILASPRAGVAEKPGPSLDATYKDIEQTLGKVPAFIGQFPKSALPGAWAEVKALEFSDNTAIPPKFKALISLAVSAQIPCNYCIWEDTMGARQAGATDQELQEAVAIAALARHWSTIFNGMQVDFQTFKKDLGGEAPAGHQATK